MITTSVSGLNFTKLAPAQMPKYNAAPLGQVKEISAERLDSSYKVASAQRIHASAEQGRQFATDAVRESTWYEPPKGSNVDAWA